MANRKRHTSIRIDRDVSHRIDDLVVETRQNRSWVIRKLLDVGLVGYSGEVQDNNNN